ncbi:hypothetical protein QN219_33265 [Sinorhizobium sp. 7-81]|uniref:hypothetical protein n=1 Tax=Sinorhizobium sp. 8-89 TaxID=3049089 RepID=UPI0024C3FECA|nr:hypothetical protein [Sinorhizobium sp. 8-89]MDK1494777.1 hypothetical protein [Sinorhizobium sp. 8-89]
MIAANAGQLTDFMVPIAAPKIAAQRNGRIRLFDSATARKFDRTCLPEGGTEPVDSYLNEVSSAGNRISAAVQESGGGRLTLAGHQSL